MTLPTLPELRVGDDPERRRRYMVRLIDRALGECEDANEADTWFAPPAAVALVERLQAVAGVRGRPPSTATEALDALLRLQRPYLRTRRYPGEDDPRLDDPATAGQLATCWHGNGVCECAAVSF